MTAVVTSGGGPEAARAPSPAGGNGEPATRRGGRLVGSTPARLRLVLGGLVAVLLAWGGVAGWLVNGREEAVNDLLTRSEPLAVNVTALYASLQDADEAAASSLLTLRSPGGVDPMRRDYDNDIAQAGNALSVIASSGGQDRQVIDDLSVISTNLPTYTGLVETARADNDQNLLLGTDYQREASTLMHAKLLPAADDLYSVETGALNADYDGSVAPPVAAFVVGPLVLLALLVGQVFLARRTRRLFNLGLVVATLATIGAMAWVGFGFAAEADALNRSSQQGSAPLEVLTRARIMALQARGDEFLSLVSRGEDSASPFDRRSLYELDLQTVTTQLAGLDRDSGLLGEARSLAWDPTERQLVDSAIGNFRSWATLHDGTIAPDVSSGSAFQAQQAVALATHQGQASFSTLDGNLAAAIEHARTGFVGSATQGRDDMSGMLYGVILLAVLGAAGAAAGIDRRLQDYR